jgi:hypothetical protein
VVERITVSYSELDNARHCLLKHRLAYRDRWVPDHVGGARHLGTQWHLLLQAHYLELMRLQGEIRAGEFGATGLQAPAPDRPFSRWQYPDGAAERIHKAVTDPEGLAAGVLYHPESGNQDEQQKLLEWMYAGYLARWGLSPEWTILAVEYTPVSWLPTVTGAKSRFDLKTKIDLVIQSVTDWLIWLVDHKSGSKSPDPRSMAIDDQFGLYTWILRRMGRPVHGAILNYASTYQTKKPKAIEDRFNHYPSDRSDAELDEIARDAYRTCVQAYGWDASRYGGYPIHPNPEWCKRRCDYLNAHLAARRGFTTIEAYLTDTGWSRDPTRH